jgi:hypothetical protein
MRRAIPIVAAVGLVVAAAGCSGDKSTKAVTVASGTANGSAWSLVTFHDKAGDLCLEIRDGAGKSDAGFGGGCGAWESSTGTHVQNPYVDGPGPAGSEFAFGPLGSAVTTVEATAPGKKTMVAQAQALPAKAGAAKFFVLPLPDATTTWTYTGKNSQGATEPLGLK